MPYSLNPKGDQFEVMDDITGKVVGVHPTRGQALAQQRALYANVPDAKAAYDWDKCIADQLEEYGDEETAKKVCGSIRAKFGEYSGKAIGTKERSDIEAELGITRKTRAMGGYITPGNDRYIEREGKEIFIPNDKPSVIDRVLALFGNKEGRRNSNTDAGRLQTIHDLAVENGATCPMIYKQANGKARWVLLSTNSYMDRDGEIISQKAQEEDVESA